MKDFMVTLSETQNYSVKVKAENEEQAKTIAEETYGMDGEISGTYVEIGECYEMTSPPSRTGGFSKSVT